MKRAWTNALRVCVLLVLASTTGPTCAQVASAAKAEVEVPGFRGEPAGHGWVVLTEPRVGAPATLLHLPPRGAGLAARGTVIAAIALDRAPARASAWDSAMYVAMPRERAGVGEEDAKVWWTYSVQRAQARAFGQTWVYPPGRAEAMPTLRVSVGAGEEPNLAAMGAGPDSLSVLVTIRKVGGVAGVRREVDWAKASMWTLVGSVWHRAVWPWERGVGKAPLEDERVLMSGGAKGPTLAIVRATGVVLWHGTIMNEGAGHHGPPELMSWSERELKLPSGAGAGRWMECAPDAEGRDTIVLATKRAEGAGGTSLWRLDHDAAAWLGAWDEPGDAWTGMIAAGAFSGPVIATYWTDAAEAAAGVGGQHRKLREVSVESGRELFSGAAKAGRTLVTTQFRVIAVVMVIFAAMVLAFVLRPEGGAPKLPEGLVMAGAARRGAALAIDLLIGGLVGSQVTSTPIGMLIDPVAYFSGEVGFSTLWIVLGCCAVIGAIGETLIGQTPGKLITGCAVVDVRGLPEAVKQVGTDGEQGVLVKGPAVWQGVVRNVLKWGALPLGALMILDKDSRHPADLIARTGVVCGKSEDEGDEEA